MTKQTTIVVIGALRVNEVYEFALDRLSNHSAKSQTTFTKWKLPPNEVMPLKMGIIL